MTITDPHDQIIWGASVAGVEEVEKYLDLMPDLRIVKIDRPFVDEYGWDVFGMLNEREIRVFDDAKLVEIPSKVEKNAEIHVRKARPWMLNCMAGVVSSMDWSNPEKDLRDGLKRFADICLEGDTKPCGVTVLTTKSKKVAKREFGRRSVDQVLWYVECMLAAGFTDVVCSPLEVKPIRKRNEFDLLELNTPGIRPAGTAVGDQKRVGTPSGTLNKGATRLVMERPLTNKETGTPAENLAAIVAEIRSR